MPWVAERPSSAYFLKNKVVSLLSYLPFSLPVKCHYKLISAAAFVISGSSILLKAWAAYHASTRFLRTFRLFVGLKDRFDCGTIHAVVESQYILTDASISPTRQPA